VFHVLDARAGDATENGEAAADKKYIHGLPLPVRSALSCQPDAILASRGRKRTQRPTPQKGNPWIVFLVRLRLAIFVAIASSRVKNVEHVPIQELFRAPRGAMLLLAWLSSSLACRRNRFSAVIFNPLFASKFSSLAQKAGADPIRSVRFGTFAGIIITGILSASCTARSSAGLGLVSLSLSSELFLPSPVLGRAPWSANFLLHLGYIP